MLRAVVFDMDGTITKPVLDFETMRREIGGLEGPILEAMEKMTPAERDRCEEILHRHEREAAGKSELADGAERMLADLKGRGLRLALVTRNSRESAETVLARHGLEETFDAVRTREHGENKPSPEPVLAMCGQMGVTPAEALVVGDYKFDIISGRDAGAATVLIHHGPRPDYADLADWVITHLDELLAIVEGNGG